MDALADMLADIKAKTLSDTLPDVNSMALVNAWTDKLAEQEAAIQTETLAKVEAKAIRSRRWLTRLQNLEAETLNDKQCEVEAESLLDALAETLVEMDPRNCVMRRPKNWSTC